MLRIPFAFSWQHNWLASTSQWGILLALASSLVLSAPKKISLAVSLPHVHTWAGSALSITPFPTCSGYDYDYD
jgi:hypothetical protein